MQKPVAIKTSSSAWAPRHHRDDTAPENEKIKGGKKKNTHKSQIRLART